MQSDVDKWSNSVNAEKKRSKIGSLHIFVKIVLEKRSQISERSKTECKR